MTRAILVAVALSSFVAVGTAVAGEFWTGNELFDECQGEGARESATGH